MSRIFADWLSAYVDFAAFRRDEEDHSEAPRRLHFWCGMSAIAGALRKRVWIDMRKYKWYPNLYVVIVAPPAVVSKSTTMGMAMQLLRCVPGIKFGPKIVTWPALVTAFAASREAFEVEGKVRLQCALTLESGEFGNLVNPGDRDMIDLLVSLYDAEDGIFEKLTKTAGTDKVESPWLNLIACTTPAWIAGTFPEYVIGGGFTSRCLFVYEEKKEHLVAYPDEFATEDYEARREALIADLTHISTDLLGQYQIPEESRKWGRDWYRQHWDGKPPKLDDNRFDSYLGRKWAHLNKAAMLLAASGGDELIITPDHYIAANVVISNLESEMPKVFAKIGRTEQSVQAERFVNFIQKRGRVSYEEAYQYVHSAFPNFREFEQIVLGAQRAGLVELVSEEGKFWLLRK